MIYFNSDYLEGAHSAIMARLAETNMMQTIGYSEDEICPSAREKINLEELKSVVYARVKELHVQKYPYNDFLYQTYEEEEE